MSQPVIAAPWPLDNATVAAAVRQAQRSPHYELAGWQMAPLGHQKIIETTGGLYLVSGQGRDHEGTTDWSLVLKTVHRPDTPDCQRPAEWCYWARELLAFDSGLLAALPGPLRAPHCYAVTPHADGGLIWMEHIVEATPRRWTLDDFACAAEVLGRFGGAFLTGAAYPQRPWLSEPFLRSSLADGDWWAQHMAVGTPESLWATPIVQEAFSDDMRRAILAIWAEKTRYFDALDRLPQVFCHNDCHRRNLMWGIDPAGSLELVALDWAFCGSGAVGTDLGMLAAVSTFFFESAVEDYDALESIVIDGYTAGLRAAGWQGDERLVRLGCIISALLWMGATLPGWTAMMLDPAAGFNIAAMYGRPATEVLAGWVALDEMLLARADEARSLLSLV
jgi:hypothetical protein